MGFTREKPFQIFSAAAKQLILQLQFTLVLEFLVPQVLDWCLVGGGRQWPTIAPDSAYSSRIVRSRREEDTENALLFAALAG